MQSLQAGSLSGGIVSLIYLYPSSFPHKLCLSSPNVRYPEMYINWPSLIFFDSKSDKACDTLYSLYSGLTTPDPLVVTQAGNKQENMKNKNQQGVHKKSFMKGKQK